MTDALTPTALSSGRAGLVAQTGRQCPQRLSELVDEIQLVERTGTGKQLRYQVLHRWPLASGSPSRPQQLRLFH